GEIVTPHQTTLMKIVDSYLQSSPNGYPNSSPKIPKTHMKLIPMLANCFTSLSAYAQNAIRRALRPSPSEVESPTSATFNPSAGPPAELDVMLPKVCETLVLVTQCIVSIILISRGTDSKPTEAEGPDALEVFYQEQLGGSAGFPENIIGKLGDRVRICGGIEVVMNLCVVDERNP
ncbi:hypothetical protein MPER_07104, partial [Moniliophthora perniciosa FA553]